MKSKYLYAITLAGTVLALGASAPATADEAIKIGFVTHAQGNPFIQQIVDAPRRRRRISASSWSSRRNPAAIRKPSFAPSRIL